MSRLHIVHRTSFTYERPVTASYNEARMRPVTFPGQRVLSSRLEATPSTWSQEYRDYWGTQVDAFEALTPHETLTVVAESRVERDAPRGDVVTCGWDALRAGALQDRMSEFLMLTPTTAPDADLVELAQDSASGREPHEAGVAICDALRAAVEYAPGATSVHTRAAEAWQARTGVCQDIVHLAAGALRAVGIPARYVSGYLHPLAASTVGEVALGESHAWIELWCGDWYAYDPTNRIGVGEHHVLVARGREYRDVTPLRGVYAGGGASTQHVEVAITLEA
ncbi:transglutaminase family protein [Georgenia wangjunii]|uniref:transglutaminase family protein n=1 Tax=Georgenia wangjunii TaxID=3117730 RepID=UPI002F269103